jgi:menaquinone-dependent protoporphyrinogen oxidase
MNKKVLVAYSTKSGSTGEVAEVIGKALRDGGVTVDISLAKDVIKLSPYGAVIVGSPILYGKWHSQALKFLKRHQETLSRIPVAYFITCMELTRLSEKKAHDMAVFLDPSLGRAPHVAGKLSLFEKSHLLSAFLDPVLKKVPQVKPFSVGFFRGELNYSKLDFISMLLMKFIWLLYKRAPEGDFRNWDVIRSWAMSLRPALTETSQEGKL